MTYAAGLACEGIKPVVAIYSTFLQRGYDQVIHDVAIQNLPVLFALDRGGLVGGDGADPAVDTLANFLEPGLDGVGQLGAAAVDGFDDAGDALIDMIVRTSNGRLTAAEALGHREFVMTKLYRSA